MIRRLLKLLLLDAIIAILPFSTSAVENSDSPICTSLEACLAILSTPATNYDKGISKSVQAAATKLQSFGRPAVKPLLQLLQSTDESVRDQAGYALSETKELLPEDLPTLQKALFFGNGWVSGAIGQIGTPEAFRALVDDLRQNPQTHTQTTGALADGGRKAIPLLLEAISCEPGCPSRELSAAIAFVFGQMNTNAVAAVEPLVDIAQDESKADELRLATLSMLKAIGPYAKAYREPLRLLTAFL